MHGLPLKVKEIEVGRIGGLSRHHRPAKRDDEGIAGGDITVWLRQLVVAPEEVRGMVALRGVAELADGCAASQVETRVRLACIDGDVAPDDLQYTVCSSDGHVVAIGDLAWLNRPRPLLGEADGESVHAMPEPVYRDRRRGNALVGEACDTIRFTFEDTFNRGYIPWAVKNALRAA